MIISLITKEQYLTMRLPDRKVGFFPLRDQHGRDLFMVEGDGRAWFLHETPLGRLQKEQTVMLKSSMLFSVRIGTSMRPAQIYAEETSPYYDKYARCLIADNASYTIGSSRTNDLVCPNPNISAYHCRLICRNRTWGVMDLNSKTGTFVNGKRIDTSTCRLYPGDMVSVLNQRFIVLPGLLAFNAQSLDISAVKKSFRQLKVPPLPFENPLASEGPTVFFHRQPRFTDELPGKDFNINPPPPPHNSATETSAILSYGPAVLSGATMLLAGMNPVYGIGMLASSLLFPKLGRQKNEQLRKKQEAQRQILYTEYLQKLEKELRELHIKQTGILRKQSPDPRLEAEKMLAEKRALWSRRPEHKDFLNLRLGLGSIPAIANVTFPQEGLNEADDPLRKMLEDFQRKPRILQNVPITLNLRDYYSVGISGEKIHRISFTAQLIAQLVMHIGYDDMQLCLLGSLSGPLSSLRWLPHTWTNEGQLHLTARNREELDHLIPALDMLLEQHQMKPNSSEDNHSNELIFLITDVSLAQSGMLTRLLFDSSYPHVHILTLADHSAQLPSRSEVVISVKEDKARMIWQEGHQRQMVDFKPDHGVNDLMRKLVHMMANTFLDVRIESASIPSVIPFLDLFGVQDVRYLNVLDRWNRADPVHTLQAPLGISEDGTLCILDVHEKKGSHGLIAGTTGSGKSELIMSYILSMAVNYSPLDVAFVLIDYKGGGMANAFTDLPHTVGIITNLLGNTLQRSLISIKSEVKRRQRIFAETQRSLGLSKVEITDYRQLFHTGKVVEPIPHLIIITDEFAEMKTQQPEFMQELISVARVGRSLGIHLILATQQPAGIVDDQIMSNMSFILCLRMASPQDSQSILHSPAAAELQQVGSFYKKTGSVMTLAQSAFTGAKYNPGKKVFPACGVEVLDHSGAVLQRQMIPSTGHIEGNAITQATVVTQYLIDLSQREGITANPLWQPVLEERILLSSLYERYLPHRDPWILNPVLGELDDPGNQRRALVRVAISEGRNTIVYGAIGSGKTMLLSALLEDLMLHHTPEQLNIYILDYADDGLYTYYTAPHVGDVVTSDEEEKLRRFLSMIEKQVSERKKTLGGSLTSTSLEERLANVSLSNILIVFHNLMNIKNHLEGDMERLMALLREGPRWGIYFLATQETANGLSFKLQESFPQKYVLQMDNDEDYAALLGRTGGRKPTALRGRGILRINDDFFEFQTASPDHDVAELCNYLKEEWKGSAAPSIRVMPERITPDILAPFLDPARPLHLPVGLDPSTIEPVFYSFESRTLHLLLGKTGDIADFLRGLVPLAVKNGLKVLALDADGFISYLTGVDVPDPSRFAEIVEGLFEECRTIRAAIDEGKPFVPTQRLIVLPSVQSLLNRLSRDSRESLQAMLEMARPEWRWTFLVCDTPQNFNMLRFSEGDKAWVMASVSTVDGLYLGGGISSQMVLHAEGEMLHQNISFPLGYVVRDAEASRVRFVAEQ